MNNGRLHVVMVPGFAGFDALGQLEYFAGINPVFHEWRETRRAHAARPVLHYFDNFPNAAVATRAGRLRRYLAKRVARGEFQSGDSLVLVGHSTGGLDIRCLLWDLSEPNREAIPVDGRGVKAAEILDLVCGAVFLSVPQWGTNIADWVHEHRAPRAALVEEMRFAVAASQAPLLGTVEGWLARGAACLTDVNVMGALRDALSEANIGACQGDAALIADAQEAESSLGLWLRHMAWDFGAIDDLTSQPPPGQSGSPAHFSEAKRKVEMARWASNKVKTLSYATRGKSDGLSSSTDCLYRACYRVCASGPFAAPVPRGAPHFPASENDGIVNTNSMLWPGGKDTVVVAADHMDIVGHYKPVRGDGLQREFVAYDLLKSDSGFDDEAFRAVWLNIFEFCVGTM